MRPGHLSSARTRCCFALDLDTAWSTEQVNVHTLLELLPGPTRSLHALGKECVFHVRDPRTRALTVPTMLYGQVRKRVSIVDETKTHHASPRGKLKRAPWGLRSTQSVSRMYFACLRVTPSSDRTTMS